MLLPLFLFPGAGAGRAIRRLLPAALFFVLTGCTVALRTDSEQCLEDADCAARGADFAGSVCIDEVCQDPPDTRWTCVGHVEPTAAGTNVELSIRLNDLLAGKPVTEASVLLCKKLDTLCSTPVESLTPDSDGVVSTTVDSSFTGYFSIDAVGYVPVRNFVDTGGPAGTVSVTMFTPAASKALNESIAPVTDPEAGFMNINMIDCNGGRAAGVHFEISPSGGASPYYVVGSILTASVTETDETGNGGFINVPEGTVTVTATLVKTGEVLGVTTTLVRKGTTTYQPMRPTPLN